MDRFFLYKDKQVAINVYFGNKSSKSYRVDVKHLKAFSDILDKGDKK